MVVGEDGICVDTLALDFMLLRGGRGMAARELATFLRPGCFRSYYFRRFLVDRCVQETCHPYEEYTDQFCSHTHTRTHRFTRKSTQLREHPFALRPYRDPLMRPLK